MNISSLDFLGIKRSQDIMRLLRIAALSSANGLPGSRRLKLYQTALKGRTPVFS